MRPTIKRTIATGIGLAVAMAVAGSAAQAQAQDKPPQSGAPAPAATPHQNATPAPGEAFPKGEGRYSFTRVDGGLLRLDSVSGRVSVCSQHAAGWACEAVPQERAALEKEIGRLQDEVAGLKTEIAVLREQAKSDKSEGQPPRPPAELTPVPDKPAKNDALKDSAKSLLPSPDRIESARAAIEKAWQRLVEMIVGFKNDVMKKG